MRALTDIVYLLGALLALPVWLPIVLGRAKYRTHWWERFGGVPRREATQRPFVWIHAVSVGEVRAAEPIVEALAHAWPEAEIGISATTKTGRDTARELFPERLTYQAPLDLSWCVARALRRLRPSLVVLMELEVWPNFVRSCAARKIPVVVANGRLSERSYPGYRRFRWLFAPVFRRLDLVLAQSERIAARFADVGVPAERIRVVGSVKYDIAAPAPAEVEAQRTDQRHRFAVAPAEYVLVAGSTHPPEHEVLVRCWQRLRAEGVLLRLILVPRHPEKPQPTAYLRAQGVPVVPLSTLEAMDETARTAAWPPEAVLLGDVMGRLLSLYALADVAFVGKSLPGVAEGGGQNPLEPASLGVVTLFGPRMRNFDAIAADLVERGAALQVADEAQLLTTLRELLEDESLRNKLGHGARQAVEAGRGAAIRTAAELNPVAFGIRKGATPTQRPGRTTNPNHEGV